MYVGFVDSYIEKYDTNKLGSGKVIVIYAENIHIVQHLEILVIYQTCQKKHKKPEMQVISQDEFWELVWWGELSAWMKYCSTKPDNSDRQKERENFKYLYSNWKLW